MAFSKSISPSFVVGTPYVITITITSGGTSNVTVTYNDVEILPATLVDGSYSFSYTPTVGGKILTTLFAAAVAGTVGLSEKITFKHNPYNNGAGVMRFKEEKNGWTSHLTFSPDLMVTLGDDLYSFKGGTLYSHTGEVAEFYDDVYDSTIGLRVSGENGVIKVLEYMTIESNVKPKFIHIITDNPYRQATDLCPADLVYVEGTFYSDILNDKLSPNFSDASESVNYNTALISGDEMRGKWFDIFMTFTNYEDFRMSAINFGMTTSSGHRKK